MKPNTRVKSILTSFIVGALLSASPLAAAAQPSRPEAIDLKGFTLTVADAAGAFNAICEWADCMKGAKYKLKYVTFATGPEALAATIGGSVHLAGTAMAPAIYATSSKTKARIVAVTSPPSSPGGLFSLVVSKKAYESGTTSISALRGKSLALTMGTEGEYLAVAALKKATVPLTSVAFSNLLPAQSFAAISGGSVGAAVVPEPFVSMLAAAGHKILTTGTGYLPGYFAFYQSDKTMKNPKVNAAISDYLRRHQAMMVKVSKNVEQGIDVYQKLFFGAYPAAVARPLASKLLVGGLANFVPITPNVIAEFQKEADVLFEVGNLRKRVNMSSAFNAKIYYSTLRSLPKIKQ